MPGLQWLKDRFGYKPIEKTALKRRVASTPWYYGDGSTLMLLLAVLVGTGLFMALSYSHAPGTAYRSVAHLTENQPLGWFVRALHYWSAGLMMVVATFHLLRQVALGGYKFPREGTWLVGVGLFFAITVMGLTGYVLRWDERALAALSVALSTFYWLPGIGEALARFVLGGDHISSYSLSRIYSVHVLWGPLALLALSGYHLFLVILHGVTSPAERQRPIHSAEHQREVYHAAAESEEHGETFYPETVASSGAVAVAVFFLAVALALLAGPAALYPEANMVGPAFPREEWWWAWYSALVALLPPGVAQAFEAFFPWVLAAVLVALPFVDRGPHRGLRKRPLAVTAVIVVVLALVGLSALRQTSPWTGWPSAEPPPVPEGAVLTPAAERGRQLFATYGCNSCHAIAGVGPQVGPDLTTLDHRLSPQELNDYILEPPEGVAMPAYRGYLEGDELAAVLQFVLVAQTWRSGRE